MGEEMRKSGIGVIGGVPWGTHLCQFYETKEDLINILVPYFKAGLENNEFCIWVTSEPLNEKEANQAMREALPDFNQYARKGQIEIVPHTRWYLKDGNFNLQRVLSAWIDKLNQALTKGYDGMRVTGNAGWLEKRNWKTFADYEEELNYAIGKYRILAICSYSIEKCAAADVIEVVKNHQQALIRQEGKWKLIESSGRKQDEEALRQSEELFRLLVENAFDGINICEFDPRTLRRRLVFGNRRYIEMSGYTREELASADDLNQLVIQHSSQKQLAHNYDCIVKGIPFIGTASWKRPDGKSNVYEWNAVSIKRGGKIHILGVDRDITERKLAEDALQQSEEKYRAIFDGSRHAMYITRRDGGFVDFNESMLSLFGYSREEMASMNVRKLYVNPADRRMFQEEVERNGFVREHELRLKKKDGTRTVCLVSSTLRMAPDGRILGYQGIIRDITEQRRLENEVLQISQREERRIGQDLHDSLGQNLMGIGLMAAALARKLARRGLAEASDAMNIAKLVKQATAETHDLARGLSPTGLEAEGLRSALEHLASSVKKMFDISCVLDCEKPISIKDSALAGHLYHIAQEAVSNAVRHGKAEHISIGLTRLNRRVVLSVTGDGVGLPEEVEDSKGMGLRIMKYRARMIGALLDIRRGDEGGTIVTCSVRA